MLEKLIKKYNIPVPRYTSYPTVPYWGEYNPDVESWKNRLKDSFIKSNNSEGISLYLHLPFCESLCTYCACNKIITRNHHVEERYIDYLIKEWLLYLEIIEEKPIIRQIHLGGGTPSFFSPKNLEILIDRLLEYCEVHAEHEFSFEAHPGNTTREHLESLYKKGFTRVSFGVQDFDIEVQQIINRIQTKEQVIELTEIAREIGYDSINFDLIYGLPKQKLSSIEQTFDIISEIKPDRIAYYSYAHVPWKTKGQRLFSEEDLPSNIFKRELYEYGKKRLLELSYSDIGMDHFSLKDDKLYESQLNKKLHRNFMGYNSSNTILLIGLGVSSISDSLTAYAQNAKTTKEYYESLDNGKLPLIRTYMLDEEDQVLRQAIKDITCKRELNLDEKILHIFPDLLSTDLVDMEREGLIKIENKRLTITDLGMVFLRNIASIFDKKLRDSNTGDKFSKSI
ncbi:MAG: oxygen-independent coproporphyrinogen III oxidase [Marinifilaceae bacterium]|jgi:oxygen-independent coproporphyrinogen-3 oxidase|nr:oxygen-independent coproporphyrinogen III oxidase [Marinifilaceae bacterium]